MKNEIAIFTPMANESRAAKKFILKVLSLKKYFSKFKYFIILDKFSTDNTFEIAKNLEKKNKSIKVIWLKNNKNVVGAYVAGYKICLKTKFKWILEIDAGGSHNPYEIKRFLPYMKNNYDCLYGSRFCKNGKMVNYNLIRYFLSRGGSLLSKLFFKINLKDTTSGFQIFRHHVLKKIIKNRIISKDRFFQTEIKIYTRKLKQKEIPITYTCKTKTVRLSSIIESIILLIKIFIKKQNYIKN